MPITLSVAFIHNTAKNKPENAMTKRMFQIMLVMAILAASFAYSGRAAASSSCASYVTVQWGDTLSGIAVSCGTTVAAIQAANPGLGWKVYAGQVLYIPTSYASDPVYYPPSGGTYVVQKGDTLKKIADRLGVSWRDIWALNPQIYNPSLIYVGQVISLPTGVVVPPPKYDPPTKYPPQPDYPVELATLKINYKHGLFVRTQPGGPIIASGLDKSAWFYRPGSVFVDSKWRVWVEVRLYPPVKGYTTGWMLVRDQFGTFFTNPRIDS
jgi:LysM repeat protein